MTLTFQSKAYHPRKGPFTLSDSESEKDQRTIGKDQSVSGITSKKMLVFAIAQCKWALTQNTKTFTNRENTYFLSFGLDTERP